MTYVYPVVSRRAGGVSVGINLNPNQACNWRCIYCQVPNLKRGGPPPINLERLHNELRDLLHALYVGDYLERHVPPEARRVVDIAFSGDGEPTSAAEFPAAVDLVGRLLDTLALPAPPRLRLITNGSLLDRKYVQNGIAALGARRGEAWFKIDAVAPDIVRRINSVAYRPASVLRRLQACGSRCETWVQTCVFAFDGNVSWLEGAAAYLELLRQAGPSITGVYLYGLARSSTQPEATRLQALPPERMEEIAARIRNETGLAVRVSP
jgi:wyosine [tRNA(Phe)-imidazoG37] synthetase (radical SAM superfamily)